MGKINFIIPDDCNGRVSLDELENKIMPVLMYSDYRERIFSNFTPFCSVLTDISPKEFILFKYPVKHDWFNKHSVYAMKFPFKLLPQFYGLSWFYFWHERNLYRLFYNGIVEFQKLTWKENDLLVENMEYPDWVYQIMENEPGWKQS